MKQGSAIFLQTLVVLIGITVLTFLLWEPHFEGRNTYATIFEIYFHDPFLAYVYIGSVPFFVALSQAFRALGYVGKNEVFLPATVRALRTIRYCSLVLMGFIAGGELLIMLSESDDRAGGVFMGLLAFLVSVAVAISAAKLEKIVQTDVVEKGPTITSSTDSDTRSTTLPTGPPSNPSLHNL